MTSHLCKLDALGGKPISRGPAARCALLLRQGYVVTNRDVVERMHQLGLVVDPPTDFNSTRYPTLTELGRAVGREYQARYIRRR